MQQKVEKTVHEKQKFAMAFWAWYNVKKVTAKTLGFREEKGWLFDMIKWIFFDVGSTLVDETRAYDHRALDMLAGTDISFAEFDQMRIALARQGFDGNSAAIGHFGLTKTPWHSEEEVPYQDANSTLAALHRRGYKLGIIANQERGTAERLEGWGMGQFFDVIAASAELGCAKPHKEIFEKALALAGCTPEESAMVGDRLDNDILPAKALGMTTVWIKQGLAQYQDTALGEGIADHPIGALGELLDIFQGGLDQIRVHFDKEELLQLNEQLNKIQKPRT